jgi:hypothetical protein
MSTLPHAWIVQQTTKGSLDRYIGAAVDRTAAEDLARIDYGSHGYERHSGLLPNEWVRDEMSSTVDLGGEYSMGYVQYVARRVDLWTCDVPGPDEPVRERRLSLADAAEEFREARTRTNEATSLLRDAVLRELAAGHPEAAVARTAGVDRMTVRKWAGKRGTP